MAFMKLSTVPSENAAAQDKGNLGHVGGTAWTVLQTNFHPPCDGGCRLYWTPIYKRGLIRRTCGDPYPRGKRGHGNHVKRRRSFMSAETQAVRFSRRFYKRLVAFPLDESDQVISATPIKMCLCIWDASFSHGVCSFAASESSPGSFLIRAQNLLHKTQSGMLIFFLHRKTPR